MIDQTHSKELVLFLQRYLAFYKDFLQLETDKYNDMSHNNLDQLDQHVKDEQVYMLKSKGLELERDKLMEKSGIPNLTFRELIPMFDDAVKDHVQTLYNELSDVLLSLKEVNLRCNYITELRLHRVEIDLKKLENHPELQKLYTQQAHDDGKRQSILSKKI